MAYDIGPKIGIEGEADFRKAINSINTNLKTLGTEMLAVTSQFDKNDKSMESLTAQNKVLNKQIDEQKRKLSELQNGLDASAKKYGENDKVTQGWQQAVNKATADLNKMERELKNNQIEIDNFGKEVKDTSNETDSFNGKLNLLGTGLANVGKLAGTAVITGVKAMGAAIVAAAVGVVGATESTKEYRNDLAKLEQNATTAGNSFDLMKDKLSELNALTGETDSSIEALSNLMATGFDDAQMTRALDALSGAVIKFPDTLKIESLADGLQETLATGEAIGPFAELIDRMGGSTEEFNKALSGATTEAEKQQVALDWLAESGLDKVNEQYKETNKNMIAAEEAQFKLNDAIADFATATEPSIAAVKTGFADILTSLVDVVTGTEGSTQEFSKNVKTFISNIINNLTSMIPTIATTFETLIPVLITGLVDAFPLIVEAVGNIGKTIINTLMTIIPQLMPVAMNLIQGLVNGIINALPELIPVAISIITGMADTIIGNIGNVVDVGISILLALIQGIVNALPALIQEVPRIINEFSNAIYEQVPKILKAGVDILLMLIKGIIDSIPTLISNIPQIIMAIVNVITLYNWASLGKSVIAKLGEGIKGMTGSIGATAKGLAESIGTVITNIFKGGLEWGKGLITNIGSGFSSMLSYISSSASSLSTTIINAIKSVFTGGFDIGKNLIQGIWNGISSVKQWILDNILGLANGIANTFKEFFGIASPSKLMAEYGQYIAEGLAQGIENNSSKPVEAMNLIADSITQTIDGTIEAVKNMASALTMSNIKNYDSLSDSERSASQKAYKDKKENEYNENESEIRDISRRNNVDLGVAQEMFRQNELDELLGKVPKYANGTNFHPGGLAWVGELGRELVELPRGSKVYTNSESQSINNQRPISLYIGTYIGDDYGLKQLERKLRGIRIGEDNRLGVVNG